MRLFISLLCLCAMSLQAGEIALTFDDAPRGNSRHFTGKERTRILLEKLEKAGVKEVAFFANSNKFSKDDGITRMADYANAGHLVANHTHSHQWIHKVGADAYIKDIQTAHEQLSNHPNFVSWFRYPFLDQGKERADQVEIAAAIRDLGYEHGYVTVDNYDWYMDHQLQNALKAGKKVDMDALRDAYIDILWQCIQFYDKLAIDALGRSPRHVLLLHENDLAALFIDDLVAFLNKQGWSIITPTQAYEDPMAKQFPEGRCRQGRLACLASETGYQGRTGHFSEDEEWLEKEFKERKVFQ